MPRGKSVEPTEGVTLEPLEKPEDVLGEVEPQEEPTAKEEPLKIENLAQLVTELKESNEQLRESNRVSQGQVRRLESRLDAVLREAAERRSSPKEEPDEFGNLDMDDPAIRTIVTQLKRLRGEMGEINRDRQSRVRTDAETAARQNILVNLEDMCTGLGLSYESLYRAVGKLPTEELWGQGRKLIYATVKKFNPDADKLKEEGKEEFIQRSGMWGERRRTETRQPDAAEALDALTDQFNLGQITREEFDRRRKSLRPRLET